MLEETLQTLGESARALFTPEQLTAFEAAFDRQAAYCRSKLYSEEGIPMFLVLEDVSGETPPTPQTGMAEVPRDALFDLLLVTATEVYKQQLEAKGEPLRSEDISLILEVLAEHFFVTAQAPSPSGHV